MKIYYFIRTLMLCAPLFWGAIVLFTFFMMGGTAVILKTFLVASGELTDHIYSKLTNGGIPQDNTLYLICRILAYLWVAIVCVILSHIVVWMFHAVFWILGVILRAIGAG